MLIILIVIINVIISDNSNNRIHLWWFVLLHQVKCVLFSRYQQRLSYDLLTGLASSLLDGQVFEIVTGLKEVQHLEEHHLSTQRMKMIHEHKGKPHPTMSYPIFFHLLYFNCPILSHFPIFSILLKCPVWYLLNLPQLLHFDHFPKIITSRPPGSPQIWNSNTEY